MMGVLNLPSPQESHFSEISAKKVQLSSPSPIYWPPSKFHTRWRRKTSSARSWWRRSCRRSITRCDMTTWRCRLVSIWWSARSCSSSFNSAGNSRPRPHPGDRRRIANTTVNTPPQNKRPTRRLPRSLAVAVALSSLLVAAIGASAEPVTDANEPFRIGFTESAFRHVNRNDAMIAVKVWSQQIVRSLNIPANPSPVFLRGLTEVRESLEKRRLRPYP